MVGLGKALAAHDGSALGRTLGKLVLLYMLFLAQASANCLIVCANLLRSVLSIKQLVLHALYFVPRTTCSRGSLLIARFPLTSLGYEQAF